MNRFGIYNRPLSWHSRTGDAAIDPKGTTAIIRWGLLPLLALLSAGGLLAVALAYAGSRSGQAGMEPLFWAGVLVIIVPIGARLASVGPSRRERLGLVVLLGVALYLVKVIHSPFGFTFSDEQLHAYNAQLIVQTGGLFHRNPILPVIAYYPGLELVTSALASLSGLSVFGAALIVVGTARLMIMLALFLLYERVTGSAQIAGAAIAVYTGSANFLFWSVQFSYESLTLPLGVVAIYALACREHAPVLERRALTAIIVLVTLTIVVSHHITSYALTVFLLVISAGYALYGRLFRQPQPNTWLLALFALGVTLTWLFLIASMTIDYLSPVLGGAVKSIIRLIVGEEATRQLFNSSSGYVAPAWERFIGIGSVLILLSGLPFGLLVVWRRYREHLLVVVLTMAALLYFGILGMRFAAAAWETSNRASTFLFLGLAMVVGAGAVEFWIPRIPWRLGPLLFGVLLGTVFMGGVISGWPPLLRLSQPLVVVAGTAILEPQGTAMARWTGEGHVIPDNVIADPSNANLLMMYGNPNVFSGREGEIRTVIEGSRIGEWQVSVFNKYKIRYIIVDRRQISWDNMRGLYFDRRNDDTWGKGFFEPKVYLKFDNRPDTSRIFDTGDIVIYDIKELSANTPLE